MSKSLMTAKTFQVWITSYPLNGDDESSKYDPGYQLVDSFDTIQDAFWCLQDNKAYGPIITKIPTWKIEVSEVIEEL